MNKCALCDGEFQPEELHTRDGKNIYHNECYWIMRDPKRYERMVKKAYEHVQG